MTKKIKSSPVKDSKKEEDFAFKKLLFNFAALVDLGEETTSNKDFKKVIKSSLYLLMGTLSVSKGIIMEYNQRNKTLGALAVKGVDWLKTFTFSIDQQTVEDIKRENHIIEFDTYSTLFKNKRKEWKKLGLRILIPLIVKEEFVGVIILGEKFSKEDYTEEDFNILSTMAKHIGISIYNHHLLNTLAHKVDENKRLYENLQLIYYDTIQAFATAIDAKDAYTKGHSRRVAKYCVAIAD